MPKLSFILFNCLGSGAAQLLQPSLYQLSLFSCRRCYEITMLYPLLMSMAAVYLINKERL